MTAPRRELRTGRPPGGRDVPGVPEGREPPAAPRGGPALPRGPGCAAPPPPPTPPRLFVPPPGAVPVPAMPRNKCLYPPPLLVCGRERPRAAVGVSPQPPRGGKKPQQPTKPTSETPSARAGEAAGRRGRGSAPRAGGARRGAARRVSVPLAAGGRQSRGCPAGWGMLQFPPPPQKNPSPTGGCCPPARPWGERSQGLRVRRAPGSPVGFAGAFLCGAACPEEEEE